MADLVPNLARKLGLAVHVDHDAPRDMHIAATADQQCQKPANLSDVLQLLPVEQQINAGALRQKRV